MTDIENCDLIINFYFIILYIMLKEFILYIVYVCFVWFCIAFIGNDFSVINDSEQFRAAFIVCWPIFWILVLAVYQITKE